MLSSQRASVTNVSLSSSRRRSSHDDEGSDDEVHAQHERYDADRPHQPVDIVAEQIAAHPVERCPDDDPKDKHERKHYTSGFGSGYERPNAAAKQAHHARSKQHVGAFMLSHDVQEREINVEGKHCQDK